ncbi:MAG: hypothetical protein ACTH6S_05160 [Mesonia sp.]|uniref:hypothetical protein n=1 Tax=Mesonia sp. TaxID=1960830 RepID=UPI003F9C5E7A
MIFSIGFNYKEYTNSDKGSKGMIDLIFRIVEKSENRIYKSIKGKLLNLDDLDALVYQELDDSKSALIEN